MIRKGEDYSFVEMSVSSSSSKEDIILSREINKNGSYLTTKVRPVIVLNNTVKYRTGNGTLETPYEIN